MKHDLSPDADLTANEQTLIENAYPQGKINNQVRALKRGTTERLNYLIYFMTHQWDKETNIEKVITPELLETTEVLLNTLGTELEKMHGGPIKNDVFSGLEKIAQALEESKRFYAKRTEEPKSDGNPEAIEKVDKNIKKVAEIFEAAAEEQIVHHFRILNEKAEQDTGALTTVKLPQIVAKLHDKTFLSKFPEMRKKLLEHCLGKVDKLYGIEDGAYRGLRNHFEAWTVLPLLAELKALTI